MSEQVQSTSTYRPDLSACPWCTTRPLHIAKQFNGRTGHRIICGDPFCPMQVATPFCGSVRVAEAMWEDRPHLFPFAMTKAEVQSKLHRVALAEGLILQLPSNHDGRNTWLLNYGLGDEAQALRAKHALRWDEHTCAAETFSNKGGDRD